MKTIAEKRAEQVNELYKRNESLGQDNACKVMNSFYRYVALRVHNFEDDNNDRTANARWHADNENREDRWLERLKKQFKQYDLILEFYGLYPTITDREGGSDVIYTYYYND